MIRNLLLLSVFLNLVFLVAPMRNALLQESVLASQTSSAEGESYLYTMKYEIPSGASIEAAQEEAEMIVQIIRATGEYDSVRLFMHHTGPELALYVHMEPKSWQAIETGAQKWVAELMANQPTWNWESHSDNILIEIPVE